jgi:hypothetical protein
MTRYNVEIEIQSGNKVTTANAKIQIKTRRKDGTHFFDTLSSTGHALRSPEDDGDKNVGEALAASRALRKLSRTLERRGNGFVITNDKRRKSLHSQIKKLVSPASGEEVSVNGNEKRSKGFAIRRTKDQVTVS